MIIILTECLTAALALYLGLTQPRSSWGTLPGVLRDIHFLVLALAALVIAWILARGRPPAAKAVLVLAAYSGIPNLLAAAELVQTFQGVMWPVLVGTWAPIIGLLLLQLTAFIMALRQLDDRKAAA